ncbi:acyl carrier protein [Clostridium novyi A str. 4552]|uniref:Acyl carrier protein n=1 Tax=Clostridium novyi A str. 4552 TaxID=1444289 RepID=A0A0A0IBI4_CLONO|nr:MULTISPECIES: acyl carrier protein [Clostridium]KEH99355.1 acyl carrier protein [Clostridium botulinum C/D str. BKT12695]KGM96970.1 acyl carrier protein [Clostridium novyi A str. 4552]NEZ48923.1 acyl carrier protein [Clostridium botulinum]
MTLDRVKKVMADHLEISEDEIKLESDFQDDLGVDSLDIFEIVMEIEDEFDLEIPNEDIENVKTVGDLVKYIDSRCE